MYVSFTSGELFGSAMSHWNLSFKHRSSILISSSMTLSISRDLILYGLCISRARLIDETISFSKFWSRSFSSTISFEKFSGVKNGSLTFQQNFSLNFWPSCSILTETGTRSLTRYYYFIRMMIWILRMSSGLSSIFIYCFLSSSFVSF